MKPDAEVKGFLEDGEKDFFACGYAGNKIKKGMFTLITGIQ